MDLRPASSLAAHIKSSTRHPVTNVYLLINYGDFVDATVSSTQNPYVQLLTMTDPATAHADFVAARLNGTDTSGNQHNPGSGSGSGSGNNDVNNTKGFYEKYKIPIIAAAAASAILVIGATAFLQFRSRRPPYRSLVEPAPAGSMQMHAVSDYNPGVQSSADYYTGAPPYSDPWGRGR